MSSHHKTRDSALASARHAPHKKHGHKFLSVYAPYIPLFLILSFGFLIGFGWKPVSADGGVVGPHVLSYATSISISDLLQETNNQRIANGLPPLALNGLLNSSAQNKANDMVARNYWSHNDPNGNPPWVFFDAVGYKYQKAGENLAYGWSTSNTTVAAWMNSAGHRANILDSTFQDVGFGFANASNYVGNGNETIVVAHYAKPLVVTAPSTPAATPKPSTAGASNTTATPAASTPAAIPAATPPPAANPVTETPTKTKDEPISSATPVPQTTPTVRVSRLSVMLGGRSAWIASVLSVITVAAVGFWIAKHAFTVRRVIRHGESYVIHHPVIDITIIAFLALVAVLTQTVGFIK